MEGSDQSSEGTIFPSTTSLQIDTMERSSSGYWQAICSRAASNSTARTWAELCSSSSVLFRPVDRDVFVRDLNRQLGTPSHWLPVDSCKKRTKGRPSGRLHSDAQVSQQEIPKLCTSVSENRVWHSEGLKNELCILCVLSPSGKNIPQSLVRNLEARASN